MLNVSLVLRLIAAVYLYKASLILVSTPFFLRIIALLILVLDIVLVIVELSVGEDRLPVKVEEAFQVLTLLFSAYFCAEVALRIVGQG